MLYGDFALCCACSALIGGRQSHGICAVGGEREEGILLGGFGRFGAFRCPLV